MTSPHQDAADLVAELRDFIVDEPNYGKCLRMSIGAEHVERAANLIEQQAKALREERFRSDRMRSQMESFRVISIRVTRERDAAEARLAEAIKERDDARADALALYQLGADVHICECCSAWMTDDERARVDVTLCPREAYGSDRFPDEPCFKHRAWLVEADRAETRSFLNSASNKEPR